MELLTTTLVIVLLTTTASAKPMGLRRHHDADITENNWRHGWLHENRRWISRSSESHSESSESQSSEESRSSEESQSSEELLTTKGTTEVVPTDTMTTASMTGITSGDGSTLAPEPGTIVLNTTLVMETTPQPEILSTPGNVTQPCNATQCFTDVIPTAVPITNRGDN